MSRIPSLRSSVLCLAVGWLALEATAQVVFDTRPIKTHYPLLPAGAFGVVDVDRDGDLDLVADDRLFLRDGLGGFSGVSATHMPPSHGGAAQVLVTDMDGDGDPDLTLSSDYSFPGFGGPPICPCPSGTGFHLFTNLTRHLEAPRLPLVGGSYELRVIARGQRPGQIDIAVPLLAPRTASLSIPPFGTLGLDPKLTIVLPAIMIPSSAGEATLQLAVPTWPSFEGMPVHAQALVLRGPSSARFTNVVHDVVLR